MIVCLVLWLTKHMVGFFFVVFFFEWFASKLIFPIKFADILEQFYRLRGFQAQVHGVTTEWPRISVTSIFNWFKVKTLQKGVSPLSKQLPSPCPTLPKIVCKSRGGFCIQMAVEMGKDLWSHSGQPLCHHCPLWRCPTYLVSGPLGWYQSAPSAKCLYVYVSILCKILMLPIPFTYKVHHSTQTLPGLQASQSPPCPTGRGRNLWLCCSACEDAGDQLLHWDPSLHTAALLLCTVLNSSMSGTFLLCILHFFRSVFFYSPVLRLS